jgi:NAD(P)-dependent dehydrogenase (short-subunit alcohol dehydrogenase family)
MRGPADGGGVDAAVASETPSVLVAGGRTAAYPCDVGDDAAVAAAVGAAASELGRITGVVTAAGIFYGPDLQPAHQVSVDDFVAVLRVNLVGTFAVNKHALPLLVSAAARS